MSRGEDGAAGCPTAGLAAMGSWAVEGAPRRALGRRREPASWPGRDGLGGGDGEGATEGPGAGGSGLWEGFRGERRQQLGRDIAAPAGARRHAWSREEESLREKGTGGQRDRGLVLVF